MINGDLQININDFLPSTAILDQEAELRGKRQRPEKNGAEGGI